MVSSVESRGYRRRVSQVRVQEEGERRRTVLICAEPDSEGMLGRFQVGLRAQSQLLGCSTPGS
jgi:hypothetical protein